MELIADILLGAGAFGAGLYCMVLSRRLKAFSGLENGMGGAIAVLSAQVDDLTQALATARNAASGSSETLQALNQRAEAAASRLELLLASLHDLPEPGTDQPSPDRDEAQPVSRRLRVLRQRARTRPEAESPHEALQ